jgi:hypothetical protein
LLLRRQRRLRIHREADTCRDAEDMSIHRHIGLIIDNRCDDIGSLAANTG